MVAAATESGPSTAAHAYVAGRTPDCSRSRARVSGMPPGSGEDESEDHRGQGNSSETKSVETLGSKPNRNHRQHTHAERQPQRELQRSSHTERGYYGVPTPSTLCYT